MKKIRKESHRKKIVHKNNSINLISYRRYSRYLQTHHVYTYCGWMEHIHFGYCVCDLISFDPFWYDSYYLLLYYACFLSICSRCINGRYKMLESKKKYIYSGHLDFVVAVVFVVFATDRKRHHKNLNTLYNVRCTLYIHCTYIVYVYTNCQIWFDKKNEKKYGNKWKEQNIKIHSIELMLTFIVRTFV